MVYVSVRSRKREKVYYFTTSKRFENFIMICIILSTGIMAMTSFPARPEPELAPGLTLTPAGHEEEWAQVIVVRGLSSTLRSPFSGENAKFGGLTLI